MARHIKTGIRSLKTPGPGAVAHMSLHQKTNDVKEPSNVQKRTTIDPRFTPGDRLSILYWRPMRTEPENPAAPRR